MSTAGQVRRLYKSRSDRMIDGVCAGIAEYFGLDPTLVRITWVLLTLLGGTGVLLYLICMIIMPKNPSAGPAAAESSRHNNSKFWGMLLVGVGVIWLLDNLGVPFWHRWWGFSWDAALPVLLILAGVGFLFGGRNYLTGTPAPEAISTPGAGPQPQPVRPARLFRSRKEKKLLGVCGGVGEYLDIDPALVRVLFVVAAFASFGAMFLLYIVMAFIVPKAPATAGAA